MVHKHEQNNGYSHPEGLSLDGDADSLQRAIAMLGGLIEGSREPMAIQDTMHHYVAFNRAYQAEGKRLFGLELNVGDDMLELAVPPEERRKALALWERTLRGETFIETQEFGDIRLGCRRSFEIQSIPLRDPTGRLIGGAHIAHDVTERHRAEAALRASEEEFRAFFESASGGKGQADATTGRLLRVNGKLCEMTGYTREELLGMTFSDILHPEERERQMETYRQARDSGAAEYSAEKRYLRKDGTVLWVQATVGFSRDEAGQAHRALAVIQDISSLKRAEQELRASEERFRRLCDASMFGLAIADAGGVLRYANPAVLEMLGYPWADVDRLHCCDFMPPERATRHVQAVEQALATGASEPYENELIARDGRRVPVLEGASLLAHDADGQPVYAFFIMDLTRLKQAEAERARLLAAQAEEHEKLQTILQHMPAGVVLAEAETERRQLINESAAQILGARLEPGSRVGEMGHQLFKADGGPYAYEEYPLVRSMRQGEVVHGEEVQVRHPNGQWRTILANSVPIRNAEGRIAAAVVIFTDITDRKQTEEALRQSEQRYQRLLGILPAAVYTCDRDGRITFYNEQAAQLWGRNPELGKDLWCGSLRLYAADRSPLAVEECPMANALREGKSQIGPEIIIERPDGSMVYAMPYVEPLRDGQGRWMGAVNVLIDTTSIRQAEQALREANRRKDEFLAMLAHELRNPLAPIRNAVQVMRMANANEAVRQRQQEIINRQVAHMARLLDDLLDVSRITRGKIEFKVRSLALSEVITHAVETAEPLIEARHQTLHLSPQPESLRVMADLDRLAQAVGNLLTNAAKYTPEGGQIWLEASREGGQAVLRVRDTGIGIAPEVLPRIFDLFAQADQGLAHSQGGLGIGLTMVRTLVQMHGGSVEAHSAGLGRGSEFIMRLPALPLAQAALPEDETEAAEG